MTLDKIQFKIRAARNLKTNKNFSRAVEIYSDVYQFIVSGSGQVYPSRTYNGAFGIDKITSTLQPFETTPKDSLEDLSSWLDNIYTELMLEYAECLLCLNDIKFDIRRHSVYQEMIRYNLYTIKFQKKKQNKIRLSNLNIFKTNPYPSKIFLMGFYHKFKSGKWKNYEFVEVEMIAPHIIYEMVIPPATMHSTHLDILVDMQFFLSKFRKRDSLFYSALAINLAKHHAIRYWYENNSHAEYLLEMQGYIQDAENEKLEEMNEMYNVSESDVIDDAFEGDFSNIWNRE